MLIRQEFIKLVASLLPPYKEWFSINAKIIPIGVAIEKRLKKSIALLNVYLTCASDPPSAIAAADL